MEDQAAFRRLGTFGAGLGGPVTARFVAVVGTVNHDVIVAADGTVRESLGGILYNALPLAALLEGTEFQVRLFGRLGAEHREEAVGLLAAFPHVNAAGLIADPAGTNRSTLDYRGGGERVESVDMRVAPLSAQDLDALAGADAVLLNMISGRDVDCQTLEALPRGDECRMFLDVQALARTLDSPRQSRRVPDASRWAHLFHVIRGNAEEVAHLGGQPEDHGKAAARLLAAGAEEVLVTRGEQGATRLVAGPGGVAREDVPAFPCPQPRDPTGCGDSFLSAVVAGHVLGLPPLAAARLGAFVAASVAGLSGLESLMELRGIRARARRFIPEIPD